MLSAVRTSDLSADQYFDRSICGIQLSARITPADGASNSGDWCEAFGVAPGVIALSIGDVCGHGDAKYPARVAIRETIREGARLGLDPAQTLTAAHYALREYDCDEYATAIFGLLDTERHTFAFANAGHPAPLLCGMAGADYLEFPETFLPIGIDGTSLPTVRTIVLPEASLLVLYTDGVIERDRMASDGSAQLREATTFAYNLRALPSANVIGSQMHVLDGGFDDAAILTAWLPRQRLS
jgi:serine phosphatase RsbU (regulator of sigma subunit)